jgi:uncharacterized SAM-binding protein YcdF (DUF218 family)
MQARALKSVGHTPIFEVHYHENMKSRDLFMEKLVKRYWTIEDNPPTQPGCFVIPSYALKNASVPTRPTCAQIELAFEWWKKFPESKLIMSTGDNQRLGITNARVMAEYAVSLGLPRKNVIEEDRSLNTYQNLKYSMEIIKARSLGQPVLVTLDLYTPRAVATARRMGWRDFCWLSVFSQGEPAYGYKYFQTYSRATLFCYEFGATVFSKLVGWV